MKNEDDKPAYRILTDLRANTNCSPFSKLKKNEQGYLLRDITLGLGMSDHHSWLTFDDRYPVVEKELADIANPAKTDLELMDSVLISGPTGTGKTAMLAAMLKHRVAIHAPKTTCKAYVVADWVFGNAVYVTYGEFCKIIRDQEGDLPLSWVRLVDSPLLMLDDVGHGFSDQAGWNLAKLSELLDLRWNAKASTWLTTNLSGAKKKKGSGWQESDLEKWIGARSFSRAADLLWMAYVELTGPDRRREPR